jgi:hypothetical protein
MPISLPSLADISRFGGKQLTSLGSSLFISPIARQVQYLANVAQPNVVIDPGLAVDLWSKKQLSNADLRTILLCHGMDLNNTGPQLMAESSLLWPSAADVLMWNTRDFDPGMPMADLFKWAGLGHNKIRRLYDEAPADFSADDIYRMFLLGILNENEFKHWLKGAGVRSEADQAKFRKLSFPLPMLVASEAYLRGFVSRKQFDEQLILSGLYDPEIREAAVKLSQAIPSPSQIEEFAVKEVWNSDVVTSFKYDEEFDQIPEFNFWMEKLGYGGSPEVPGGKPNQPTTWAQAFWRAHWRTISNSEAYTMLHRLRPTGGPNGGPRDPSGQVWTMQDVNRVLKVNDYAPFFREKLAAISYAPLRLVDIRRTVQLSLEDHRFKERVIGTRFTIKEWATEEFLDRGQAPNKAPVLAEIAIAGARKTLEAPLRKVDQTLKRAQGKLLFDQYRLGTITRSKFFNDLPEYGYTDQQANRFANLIEGQIALATVKQQIEWVRRKVFKGAILPGEVGSLLTKLGLTQARADELSASWKFLLDEDAILRATQWILDALKKGVMPLGVAQQRLGNLGWSQADILLETANAESSMSEMVG